MQNRQPPPIYLDYMATTPVDPKAAAAMQQCLTINGSFGNASSNTHYYGWQAAELVAQAKKQVAALVNAKPEEVVWTSGATEADNLALIGASSFYKRKGKHIITMRTEHKAVLSCCEYLADNGFEVTLLDPNADGRLDLNKLSDALRQDTILVSIMYVNNETGVIQDIEVIGELLRNKGIIFHVDAAQAVGKIAIDLAELNVDLMSFSAHKLYGPKGMGALYVRRTPRVRLQPLIYGGKQQHGLRPGTLATHQIVGMGSAFAVAKQRFVADSNHLKKLRKILWQKLNQLEGMHLHGSLIHSIDGCLNVRFEGITGEKLLLALPEIAISAGSACTSSIAAPSHVLLGMGLSDEKAYQALRISMGRFTSEQDIELAAAYICEQVQKLRAV